MDNPLDSWMKVMKANEDAMDRQREIDNMEMMLENCGLEKGMNCFVAQFDIEKMTNDERKWELEKLRNELATKGGIFGYDAGDAVGERRDLLEKKEFLKAIRFLALGEKKINLKEREFRAF